MPSSTVEFDPSSWRRKALKIWSIASHSHRTVPISYVTGGSITDAERDSLHRPAAAVIAASCGATKTSAPSTEDHFMRTPHVLILFAALAVAASLGIRHWAGGTVIAPKDVSRESSSSLASVHDAAPSAIARTLNDAADNAAMPQSGISSRPPIPGAVPIEDARSVSATFDSPAVVASSSDPTGTPDAPGDPEAQPENPSEQFMHSRRGDGQHQE